MKNFVRELLHKAHLRGPAFMIYWSARPRAIFHNIPYWIKGAPDALPLPPLKLRARVWGEYTDIRLFLQPNQQIQQALDILAQHGAKVDEFEAILDFGCGAGRALRQFPHLKRHSIKAKIYGTDINPEQIVWCRRNLSFAEFDVNQPYPPLIYDDAKFDFIYTYSVFTHLPEAHQLLWIDELSRVLKPGGYLLLTTCGESYFETLSQNEKEQFRAGQLVVRHGELAGVPSTYNDCIVFHPVAYVGETLAKQFEIAHFFPGEASPSGPKGEMDHYFLRKPFKNNEAG
jgi:SAM-dependent methyltransferase